MSDLVYTPSQTNGPLFGFSLIQPEITAVAVPEGKRALHLKGCIYDGEGNHIDYGAFIEFWSQGQAVRVRTLKGCFETTMIWPEPRRLPSGELLAPQISVMLSTRGLSNTLWTKIFLPDTPELAADPIWNAIDPERRPYALARPEGEGFVFDWHLQGEREAPIFDLHEGDHP